MKKMTSEEIINTYINFFKSHDHLQLESASLIPKDDPSILWVNAGVTPLKKYFDGTKIPPKRRITSCQKCIRTNDIENVGITARHHTFFQMLGNFSIGDYFKEEALTWAFELLTSKNYFHLPIDKLYVTVYTNDLEAYNIWKKLGMPADHIIKLDGNYWEIGEGPSGPDSEVFFDRGREYDPENQGLKLLKEEIENDRYIEIWNNVFSQYNAKKGIPREEYEELPSKNIDTGMGVERMACILQNGKTNYETDLFLPIIEKLEEITQIKYTGQKEFKVIVDHARSLTFAISDGATFENYGRGYVLRRLLRRSVMMGHRLEINHPFMEELASIVCNKYATIYPELLGNIGIIKKLINQEELLFEKTILAGEKRLEEIFTTEESNIISGRDAFKLYDTYGFPIELTIEYASEKGFKVNIDEYKKYMNAQKEMAKRNHKNISSMNLQNEALINFTKESKFVGYEKLGNKTKVIGIFKDDKFVDYIDNNSSEAYIFLEENPFYATSGGQIYDTGYIKNDDVKLEVLEVIKAPNGQHMLKIKVLSGILKNNTEVLTHVLQERRGEIAKNHSSVHILQKTLQQFLGDNVHQAGSYVDEDGFRFDFNYRGRLSDDIITKIEEKVNEKVDAAYETKIEYLPLAEAKKRGAMALFEDKYGEIVRMVTIGDSVELCAGTHVKNTKEIEKIAIISVTNKGADTYRIEGTTKKNISKMLTEAVKPYYKEITKLLKKAKSIIEIAKKESINLYFDYDFDELKLTSFKDVISYKDSLIELKEKLKDLEKSYQNTKVNKAASNIDAFTTNIEVINNIKVMIAIVEDYTTDEIKGIVSAICNKYDNCFTLLANISNNNVNIIAKSNSPKINCGSIVKELSIKCEGNGGGSKTFAQGGGRNAKDISKYLSSIKEEIKNTNI